MKERRKEGKKVRRREGRKEGKTEGREGGRKEGRKERRKERKSIIRVLDNTQNEKLLDVLSYEKSFRALTTWSPKINISFYN